MFEILIKKTDKTQSDTDYVHVCPHAGIDTVTKMVVSYDIDGEYASVLICLPCFNVGFIDSLISTNNKSN